MKLYIGGKGSGQEQVALSETGIITENCTPDEALTKAGVKNFHEVIRQVLLENGNPQSFAEVLTERNPDAVIVSDEIGMGIVPAERFERQWREETGRALCILAQKAERVVRVTCGISQVIK